MKSFINQLHSHFASPLPYQKITEEALSEARTMFESTEEVSAYNQLKVLNAFQNNKASDFHLHGSTGYGYGDTGRDVLEDIFNDIFKAEKSLVRSNLVSGTHALATVLFGILRPGDHVLSISGQPYDTLLKVIGKNKEAGTLDELMIRYDVIDLDDSGNFKTEEIANYLENNPCKMICIQRSRGYSLRTSISIDKLEQISSFIKNISPDCIVFVDNCYGEFVENSEPLEAGADIIAGSLIKNPGGGLAIRGGYICGKESLVTLASHRLTAPGIHQDVSSALDFNRTVYQGLFMAPLIVEQAIKGAVFTSALFENLGFSVLPSSKDHRTDIVQAIVLNSPELLEIFCRGIQSGSPLDSYVRPAYGQLPGYADPVIMAGGTFIQGSSIELSADGPMREPYVAYMQGGLSFSHVLYAAIKTGLTIYNKKESVE